MADKYFVAIFFWKISFRGICNNQSRKYKKFENKFECPWVKLWRGKKIAKFVMWGSGFRNQKSVFKIDLEKVVHFFWQV